MTDRFETLWTSYLEGDLDAAGMAELDVLLQGDPELLKRAARRYEEHRLLGLVVRPPSSDLFVRETLDQVRSGSDAFVKGVVGKLETSKPRAAWRPAFFVGIAAGLLLAFTFVFVLMRAPSSVPAAPVEYVASVVRAGADASLAEGERLPADRIAVDQGAVMIRFDAGATAILSGPAEITLDSRHAATLHAGRATVRCGSEAAGFTLRTPAGEVVDLGTEFAVTADRDATEVQVLEGTVQWRVPRRPDEAQEIAAGQALRIGPDGTATTRAADAPRFGDLARAMIPSGSEGTLLAYEGFDYPEGNHPVESLAGGTGWAGPWRIRQGVEVSGKDVTSDLRIRSRPLDLPWKIARTQAGSLQLPKGTRFRIRELASPINLGRDGVTFVSFIVREELDIPERRGKGRQATFRMTFRSKAAYWGQSFSLQMAPSLHAQVDLAGGGVMRSAEPYPAGAPVLWVAKVVTRRDGMDQVFFRTYGPDEPLDAYEPLTWTAVTPIFKSDATLDLLVVTGTGWGSHDLDEIRVGTSWAAVTPAP